MRTGEHEYGGFISGNHRFNIPEYQRNYSWEEQHFEDFWDDLVEDLNKTHFFGTFLIQETKGANPRDKVLDIIDGQQRLTSTLILLLELRRQFRSMDLEDEADEIDRNYLFEGEKPKLTLMGDDKSFFKDRIFGGILGPEGGDQEETKPMPENVDTPSRRRLLNAKRFFRDKLVEVSSKMDDDEFRGWSLSLLQKVEDMDAMVYKVDSRAEAVRIFQAVNDRGKQLSDLEKTKSYLMHQLYLLIPDDKEDHLEEQIERVQRKFGKIYNHIDSINDTSVGSSITEDDVQRYHFIIWDEDWSISRGKKDYQAHLEHLKMRFDNQNDGSNQIIEYTDELERAFDALRHLTSQDHNLSDSSNEQLTRLFTIGRLSNFYPILISLLMKYNSGQIMEEEMRQFLHRIETFIVRVYAIQQKATDTGRTKLYTLARRFHKDNFIQGKKPLRIGGATSQLNKYIHDYCDDDSLKRVLAKNNVYEYYDKSNRRHELRYLLYFCENHLEKGLEGISLDLTNVVENSDEDYSIEHIWPKDPSKLDITTEDMEIHNENKHRLGNLALMTRPWNSAESNKPYQKKRPKYRESRLRMLNQIAEKYDCWDQETIEERESWMIDVIVEEWPDKRQVQSASLTDFA